MSLSTKHNIKTFKTSLIILITFVTQLKNSIDNEATGKTEKSNCSCIVLRFIYMTSPMNNFKIMMATLKAMVCALLFWGLSGCVPAGPVPPLSMDENTIPSPREILDSVGNSPALPDLEPMIVMEPQVAALKDFPYEGKLFSLSVRDMPLEDILLALAQEAALNLVIDRDVKRDELLSVEFANIPLQIALDNLMDIHDYYYTISNGVLRIRAFEERVFQLNYPMIYSTSESETGGDVLGGNSGGDSEVLSVASSGAIKGEFTIKTSVDDEEDLNVWKQIEDALELPQKGKRGLVSEEAVVRLNRMGSTIFVKDHPSNIRAVAKFLQQIQETLRRQVVIEAKIVEVVLDKSHQYGVNWEHVRFNFANSGGILESSMNLGALGSSGAFSMHFADFVGMDQGEAFLHALATNGQVNMLSSPRLNVINNQSAFINVGRIVPFIDYQITSTPATENEAASTQSEPVIARFNEGVSLGITPQIDEEGSTILHIVPIVTEQTGTESIEFPATVVGGESIIVNIPIVSVRESDTMIRVEDRTTVVIGGLISEITGDTVKKVPLLGDIPFINWAFSHQDRQNKKSELVIMLTTTVIMR